MSSTYNGTQCDIVEVKNKYLKCDPIKDQDLVLYVLYALIGFQLPFIFVTSLVFTICIFKQRRRQKRHFLQRKDPILANSGKATSGSVATLTPMPNDGQPAAEPKKNA